MKRISLLALLAASLLGAGTAQAVAPQVSAGIFGGSSVPVLQDVTVSSFSFSDAFGPSGSQWGLRADVKLIPVVTLEPFFSKSSYGEDTETFGGIEYTREGFDGTAYGLNAILGWTEGPGVHFFPYIGLGKFKLDRAAEEIDELGWNFGLGLGIGVIEKLSAQIRSEMTMVVTDDTSRKFVTFNVGVNYAVMP